VPAPRHYTTADFDYDCPRELIAQYPVPNRADSRLLVLDRRTGAIAHHQFRQLPTLLTPGDLVVLNVSRVIRARLMGRRENGRLAEILLVHPQPDGTWIAMVHPGGKLKAGRTVVLEAPPGSSVTRPPTEPGETVEIVEVLGGGLRRVRFRGVTPERAMDRFGSVPLPPYIERAPEPADRDRYQTVYARVDGSVAAPTAGLHFTPELLAAIEEQGVGTAEVILHVGPGTFKPVDVVNPTNHAMHAEWYELTPAMADRINAARTSGGRIWAVGTTAARVLETVARGSTSSRADEQAIVAPGSGWTDLFIFPPYRFRAVDALLTNFHLPRSTLLMLVSAFAGYDATMSAYAEAVRERYRLYSYVPRAHNAGVRGTCGQAH
jgi:S-adenosylmethionine:tRNA ribosyltransferase-isomerase